MALTAPRTLDLSKQRLLMCAFSTRSHFPANHSHAVTQMTHCPGTSCFHDPLSAFSTAITILMQIPPNPEEADDYTHLRRF